MCNRATDGKIDLLSVAGDHNSRLKMYVFKKRRHLVQGLFLKHFVISPSALLHRQEY